MNRAQQNSWTFVDKNSHAILQVNFSAKGFLHYATFSTGAEHNFELVLIKMVYNKDNETDWNVSHFNMDLPLAANGPDGDVWISTVWHSVD